MYEQSADSSRSATGDLESFLSVLIQHRSPAKVQARISCDLLQPPANAVLQDAARSDK